VLVTTYLDDPPTGIDAKVRAGEDRKLVPVEQHGIRAISMGMFLGEHTPVIWRGPMVTKLVTEFLRNVVWGELDVLVIDLPPGTGDVQLTLTQQVPITGGVIVTTPQDVALADVRRGVQMFRQVHAPVLGVIENMSFHICPGCGERAELFAHGRGAEMARSLGQPDFYPFVMCKPVVAKLHFIHMVIADARKNPQP